MISVASAFSAAIAGDTVKIAELYQIELATGTTYYFTSHNKDISWNSQTYTAMPIKRNPTRKTLDLQSDELEVQIGNISGALAALLMTEGLESAQLTLKRIRWNATYASDEEYTVFKGVANVSFDRRIMTIRFTSWLDSLNILVPKCLYQEPCCHRLFDTSCDLTKATYLIQGTATGGAVSYVEYAGSGEPFDTITAEGDDYFLLGEVKMDGGTAANLNQRRMIREIDTTNRRIYVSYAFPAAVANTDTFDVYPGCDKKPETCRDRFSNIENFRGFTYIPKPESIRK